MTSRDVPLEDLGVLSERGMGFPHGIGTFFLSFSFATSTGVFSFTYWGVGGEWGICAFRIGFRSRAWSGARLAFDTQQRHFGESGQLFSFRTWTPERKRWVCFQRKRTLGRAV